MQQPKGKGVEDPRNPGEHARSTGLVSLVVEVSTFGILCGLSAISGRSSGFVSNMVSIVSPTSGESASRVDNTTSIPCEDGDWSRQSKLLEVTSVGLQLPDALAFGLSSFLSVTTGFFSELTVITVSLLRGTSAARGETGGVKSRGDGGGLERGDRDLIRGCTGG